MKKMHRKGTGENKSSEASNGSEKKKDSSSSVITTPPSTKKAKKSTQTKISSFATISVNSTPTPTLSQSTTSTCSDGGNSKPGKQPVVCVDAEPCNDLTSAIVSNATETVAFSDTTVTSTTTTTSTNTISAVNAKSSTTATVKKDLLIPNPNIPVFMSKPLNNGKFSYSIMIHDAIASLKEHKGSSIHAITKYMLSKYHYLAKINTTIVKKTITKAIKLGTKEGHFTKIKSSFKINQEWLKKQKAAHRAKENLRKAKEKLRLKELEKVRVEKKKIEEEARKAKEKLIRDQREEEEKKLKFIKDQQDRQKKLAADILETELMNKKIKLEMEEAAKRKIEAAAMARALKERIRKRKFPMDDLDLIAEDKELNVKPPDDVTEPPVLPDIMSALVPFHERTETINTDTPQSILSASSPCITNFSRGLISDMIQVHHFFHGDVGLCRQTPLAPDFSFKNFLFAVNEIQIGNAKRAKLVPPLIAHLFVAALDMLLDPRVSNSNEESLESQEHTQLSTDLKRLKIGLNSSSWGEILFLYIDFMQKYYTSDASVDPNVLPGFPISLYDETCDLNLDLQSPNTSSSFNSSNSFHTSQTLSNGYEGYLGPSKSTLSKAHKKLLTNDPWCFSAEELLSLLRTLTDDILAQQVELAEDIFNRGEKILDLLKTKKSTEYNFKKARLAYEGPKDMRKYVKAQPKNLADISVCKGNTDDSKVLETGGTDSAVGDKQLSHTENHQTSLLSYEDKSNEADESQMESKEVVTENSKAQECTEFKPTVTKKEFVEAEKARDRAFEAYEKGLRVLVSRSKPIGYDRHYNSIYYFYHDPNALYIEKRGATFKGFLHPSTSWHVIDTKGMFQKYISSLDVRGIRESDLYDELYEGYGMMTLKRSLYDDNKRRNLLYARQKEEEEFQRRLANAKLACEDEASGRRSGRLAVAAKDELTKITREMDKASKKFKAQSELKSINYQSLTGLELIREFDSNRKEKDLCCSSLWDDKNRDSCGVVGAIASQILSLDDSCSELLSSSERSVARKEWKKSIDRALRLWKHSLELHVGPAKHMSTEHRSDGSSVIQALAFLRKPLLELESTIYYISGLRMADEDNFDASDILYESSEDRNISNRSQTLWKRKIHLLHNVAPSRIATVRKTLVSSIIIARKGGLIDVESDLQDVLKLLRPGGAVNCRNAALCILKKYGDYKSSDDGTSDLDLTDDDFMETDSLDDNQSEINCSSLLCFEAEKISSCLGGDNDSDRNDWVEAVKEAKTMSRFAALVQTLYTKAEPILTRLKRDKEMLTLAIQYWKTKSERRTRTKISKSKGKFNSKVEIWTDFSKTNEIVMVKVEGNPWWPGRICIPKDPGISSSLSSLDRVLVSFIGDQFLHVVRDPEEVKKFEDIQSSEEHLSEYSPEIQAKWKQVS
mmetsp:Transcript_21852/g.30686  ORF Transcript_21852/g.30686 Transcript_21852/m.30686 type:complete len:1406 (+) Transcript_21852:73-4290(+)